MRQWKKKVTNREAGRSLQQILRTEGFTKKEISRLKFRESGMTVDGIPCRSTQILSEGQEIILNLGVEAPEASAEAAASGAVCGGTSLHICYEDADILIADKPSGLSCHTGRGHYHENLGRQIEAYCAAKGGHGAVRLIGRLDKDTSGAMVAAKNQIASARLWKQRETGIFQKKYLALVHGRLEQKTFVISLPIGEACRKNRMQVAADGKKAVTSCSVLREFVHNEEKEIWEEVRNESETAGREIISLVECTLMTGRTHQIRVHMAAIGHPVLGDSFYGIADGCSRLCLHAGMISLMQPFTGEKIEVQIPVKGIPFQ